jgi:cytochrome c oxidase assembly protein subunit 15
MGWYMVKSGLVDDPRVSHYRLTAHLSLAFLIFVAMFWVALGLLAERARSAHEAGVRQLQRMGFWLAILVGYMVVTGGLVAGIRAGKAYNTFPLMNGHLLPPESFILDPWYLNFFNNMALVQFDHRLGAWLLAFLLPWFWWKIRSAAVSSGLAWWQRCCWWWCSSRLGSASPRCCWPFPSVWVPRIRAEPWSCLVCCCG